MPCLRWRADLAIWTVASQEDVTPSESAILLPGHVVTVVLSSKMADGADHQRTRAQRTRGTDHRMAADGTVKEDLGPVKPTKSQVSTYEHFQNCYREDKGTSKGLWSNQAYRITNRNL